MFRELPLPEGVHVILKDWATWSRQTIRLAPAQGKYAVYRRLSKHRIGPKTKTRTYCVHEEKRAVHSLGEVRLALFDNENELELFFKELKSTAVVVGPAGSAGAGADPSFAVDRNFSS